MLDDLSAGPLPRLPATFIRGDVADRELVVQLVREQRITAVVHFAGKIQVGESISHPALYFEYNVVRTLALLNAIKDHVEYFVFSSSAAVYGTPDLVPIPETSRLSPINPYGSSKLAIELALAAYGEAYGTRWAALRYFNAAGAAPDGSLRENHEPETHLIPLAIDAALGRRPPLTIFGDDYPTPDGTCIRDYVHVGDIAVAHLSALHALGSGVSVGACNLGSARGFSVREVVAATGRVTGRNVPFAVGARRAGDPAVLVASNARARSLLGWDPSRSNLDTIIDDAVRSR